MCRRTGSCCCFHTTEHSVLGRYNRKMYGVMQYLPQHRQQKLPLALGSLLDEIVVDVPDKLITLIIVFLILKGLPKKLTTLYDTEETIESLD